MIALTPAPSITAQRARYAVRLTAAAPHRGSITYRSARIPWPTARAALIDAMEHYEGRFPIGSARQVSHLETDYVIHITERRGMLNVTIGSDGAGSTVMFAVDLATRRVVDAMEAIDAL